MWFLEVQANLMRSWLAAAEATTSACLEATRNMTEAWSKAAAPSPASGFQLAFPFAPPTVMPFPGFPAFVPFNPFAMASDWQRQWAPQAWPFAPPMAMFPWASPGLPWNGLGFWGAFGNQRTPSFADLMATSYRTASGHAAAAVMMAPFQQTSVPATNWFGWPAITHRGYLN